MLTKIGNVNLHPAHILWTYLNDLLIRVLFKALGSDLIFSKDSKQMNSPHIKYSKY